MTIKPATYQKDTHYNNGAIRVSVGEDGAILTKLSGKTAIASVVMTRQQAAEVFQFLSEGLEDMPAILGYEESQRRHLCPYCALPGEPCRTYDPHMERLFNAYRCQGGSAHLFYVEKRFETEVTPPQPSPVKQIFLGGTCGDNHWREQIVIPRLLERGIPSQLLFNPVGEHWTPEVQAHEDEIKRSADVLVFVIASPDPSAKEVTAVSGYSLVELTMSLYDAPERTVALFDTTGMSARTAKGINKVADDLRHRFPQAPIFTSYDSLIDWLYKRVLFFDQPF